MTVGAGAWGWGWGGLSMCHQPFKVKSPYDEATVPAPPVFKSSNVSPVAAAGVMPANAATPAMTAPSKSCFLLLFFDILNLLRNYYVVYKHSLANRHNLSQSRPRQ